VTIRITTVPRAIKEFGPPDKWPEYEVYVGRACPRRGLKASPLANPYAAESLPGDRGDDARRRAVRLYRDRLQRLLDVREVRPDRFPEAHDAISMQAVIASLRLLGSRHGRLVLVCWCFHENEDGTWQGKRPCHAEVIREVLGAK